jgi:molybdopterin-guanine dinucleotide biosynthesis protein A
MMHTKITGVVLAGGQGRRMGGIDKGLQLLRGKPMIAWVLERFQPQVTEILINANQHFEEYAAYGYPVIKDEIDGYAGPLAGLQAALRHANHSLVATVPCDSPFLPDDLIPRLHLVMQQHEADVAVAKTGTQAHPVFSICRRGVRDHLDAFLAGGGRKIDQWYSTLKVVEVPFDDEPAMFTNFNTPEDLARHEYRAVP